MVLQVNHVEKRPGGRHSAWFCRSFWQSPPSATSLFNSAILWNKRSSTQLGAILPETKKTADTFGWELFFSSERCLRCTTGYSLGPPTISGLYQWPAWCCQPLRSLSLCRWLSLIYRLVRIDDEARRMQEDLDALEVQETKWQMKFYLEKCQVIRINFNVRWSE